MNSLGGLALLFPTDLAAFLDLIRQHGKVAYSFMFGYAMPAYAAARDLRGLCHASRRAASLGPLLLAVLGRHLRGRRHPLLDWAALRHAVAPPHAAPRKGAPCGRWPGSPTVIMSG